MNTDSTLITGLSQKDLTAYLETRKFEDTVFQNFFPFQFTPTLENSVLLGSKGFRVAGDIVAFDSSAPEKKRKALDKINFELAAIRLKRIMTETNLNKYFTLQNFANDEAKKEALKLIFDDVEFCAQGVYGRLEWIFGQVLSTGYLNITTDNNAGVVTPVTVDFQVPTGNRSVMTAANRYWTTANATTAKPITDVEAVVEGARASGHKLKYICMNREKFVAFKTAAETIDFVNGLILVDSGAVNSNMKPGLKAINAALFEADLPQIILIDSYVTIEKADHTQENVDVWQDASGSDRYVSFIPQVQVGNMMYCPTAEEQVGPRQAIHAKNGPVLVSRWASMDPVHEITAGLLNAFPSFPTAKECYFIDTESHTTYGA